MRGTPTSRTYDSKGDRFIPAHAGNTPTRPPCRPPPSVHPRACGEHISTPEYLLISAGSSPRMRGTRTHPAHPADDRRFIPAHAGNTQNFGDRRSVLPVHPRACGEHSTKPRTSRTATGSSPRMRGTQDAASAYAEVRRFIPAHAGNTYYRRKTQSEKTVHPRACGEHSSSAGTCATIAGSSPRMRGTQRGARDRPPGRRFIPAHAGNTWRSRRRTARPAVHPRACGEHLSDSFVHLDASGSSPRMRGTRRDVVVFRLVRRFIPAHAGNTH